MQTTGWPPGLLQDDSRELSRWLSTRLGARYQIQRNNMQTNQTPEALADELRLNLSYDESTGELTWLKGPLCGKAAGCLRPDGYIDITFRRKQRQAASVAWAILHGAWPDGVVDHINGNPGDNRAANLRLADLCQNQHNTRIRRDNSSGFKGVSYFGQIGKWVARIRYRGKMHYLGAFSSVLDAAAAYKSASEKYHGEFRRETQ